jgi:hypothetical protein
MEILQYNNLMDYSKYIFNDIYINNTDYTDIQKIFNKACIDNNIKIIKYLLKKENPNIDIKQGLIIASECDNIKIMRLLSYFNKN